MKPTTLLLSAALVASTGGMVWLYQENASLRDQVAGLSLQADDQKPRENPGAAPRTSAIPGAGGPGAGAAGARTAVSGKPGTAPGPQPLSNSAGVKTQTGEKAVTASPDGGVIIHDPAGGPDRALTAEQARRLTQEVEVALAENATKLPGGPSWSPGQAAGPPNTGNHGDYSTAWASQQQDGGAEWLKVKYAKSVEVSEINIHESYNPGAVSRVSAILPDGSQKVIWEGVEPPEQGLVERTVKVPPGIRSDQIMIELDTRRVPGWNEIDAVEIVGRDGSRQWGAESTASSYFGGGRAYGSQMLNFGTDTDLFIEELSSSR